MLYGLLAAPKQHGLHYIGASFLKNGAIMQMERQPNHRRQMSKVIIFILDTSVKAGFILFFWVLFSTIRSVFGF